MCDNEPFYDYESSRENSAANQQKGDTLSLSKINFTENDEQDVQIDLSSIEKPIFEPDDSF